jgi:hypothetical protein
MDVHIDPVKLHRELMHRSTGPSIGSPYGATGSATKKPSPAVWNRERVFQLSEDQHKKKDSEILGEDPCILKNSILKNSILKNGILKNGIHLNG